MNDDTEKNISPEKIVEYLGLKNIDELASVLSEVLGKTLKPGKNLIYNSLHYFEINSVSSKYDLSNNFPIITSILYNKRHVGWQCVLGYDKRYYRKYDRDTSLEKQTGPLQVGHILSLGLFSFVRQNGLENICNDQELNLIPQFERANESKDEDVGQGKFENWVWSYLDNYKDQEIYYEVEEIFYKPKDIIPIGTRIFACRYKTILDKLKNTSKGGNSAIPFHVFIPNYGFNKEKKYDSNYLYRKSDRVRKFYRTFYGKWDNLK